MSLRACWWTNGAVKRNMRLDWRRQRSFDDCEKSLDLWICCSHTTRLWLGWEQSESSRKKVGKPSGLQFFMSGCFGPTKKPKSSAGMLKGKERGGPVVWFLKTVVLLRLRSRRGDGGGKVAFVQYMEVTAPLDAVEENHGCICEKWYTSDEMDQIVCSKELKKLVRKVVESYGREVLSSMMGSAYLVRSNPALHPFTTEMPWLHHQFYVNPFYIDGTAHTETGEWVA